MYKIMEKKNDSVKTLFHGINRSRTVSLGKWLQADVKEVTDGSKNSTYISGWHMLPTHKECVAYLEKFRHKDNKVIVKCRTKGKTWPKTQSRANVILSEWIYLEAIV